MSSTNICNVMSATHSMFIYGGCHGIAVNDGLQVCKSLLTHVMYMCLVC